MSYKRQIDRHGKGYRSQIDENRQNCMHRNQRDRLTDIETNVAQRYHALIPDRQRERYQENSIKTYHRIFLYQTAAAQHVLPQCSLISYAIQLKALKRIA